MSKIQILCEFSAHSKKINCISLGKKTGTVIATGSDDCEIRIWKTGKTTPILCLEDKNSPVTSLIFDQKEDTILTGTEEGTLVIYDLEKQEVGCRLGGEKPHLSSVNCVDSHPYGYFLASGSSDQSLKIWDIRSPTAIQTYHTGAPISKVKCSPDGKFVSSGDITGAIKLWNLTAGSCMSTVNTNGPISSLEFHPLECMLASGSQQIDLWDLDQPSRPIRVAYSKPEPTVHNGICISSLLFCNQQDRLFSACNNNNNSIEIWNLPDYSQTDIISSSEILLQKPNSKFYSDLNDISFQPAHNNIPQRIVFVCTDKDKIIEYSVSNIEQIIHSPPTDKIETQNFLKRTHDIQKLPKQERKRSRNYESIQRILHTENDTILKSDSFLSDTRQNLSDTKNALSDFLPQPRTEETVCSQLLHDHEQFLGLLNHKLSTIRIIRKLWDIGDVKGSLNILYSQDLTVCYEFLTFALYQIKSICTIDHAVLLLPICNRLLGSKLDLHLQLSLTMIDFLIVKFSNVIIHSKKIQKNPEYDKLELLTKCNSFISHLKIILSLIEKLSNENNNYVDISLTVTSLSSRIKKMCMC